MNWFTYIMGIDIYFKVKAIHNIKEKNNQKYKKN